MKAHYLMALVLALGLGMAVGDAEARRMGGGKSLGMQRQSTTANKAPDAPAAPRQAAQTPATPASAAAPATAAASTAAAAQKRSWMGPLAGIAAGLGIAALASHLGFGEELASMLMLGLLAFAVLAAVGWFMRRRAATQGGAGMARTAYAGAGAGAGSGGMPAPAAPAQGGSLIGAKLQPGVASAIPAGFDVAAFERNAKVQFIRLQAAHDAGNLDDIRSFTTPEMFAEIRMDVSERGAAEQHTEVLQLDAEVLSVEEEGLLYVASVRFHGQLREERGGAPSDVDEVWHLTKPRAGSSGWVLAGIQQRG